MVVCRFFQQGRCSYGAQCRNEHPGGGPTLASAGMQTGSAPHGSSAAGPFQQHHQQQQQQPQAQNFGFNHSNSNAPFGGTSSNAQLGSNSFQQQHGGGGGYNNRGGYRGGGRGGRGGRGGAGRGGGRGGGYEGGQAPRGAGVPAGVSREQEAAFRVKEAVEKNVPQWPLTCFGMDSEPSLIQGDVCAEELRAEGYAAVLQGATVEMVVQHEAARVQAHAELYTALIAQCDAALQPALQHGFGASPPPSSAAAMPFGPTNSTSPFGGAPSAGAASPFGSAAVGANASPFGATAAASPFVGGAASAQSPFGGGGAAGVQSPFGAAPNPGGGASPFGRSA